MREWFKYAYLTIHRWRVNLYCSTSWHLPKTSPVAFLQIKPCIIKEIDVNIEVILICQRYHVGKFVLGNWRVQSNCMYIVSKCACHSERNMRLPNWPTWSSRQCNISRPWSTDCIRGLKCSSIFRQRSQDSFKDGVLEPYVSNLQRRATIMVIAQTKASGTVSLSGYKRFFCEFEVMTHNGTHASLQL